MDFPRETKEAGVMKGYQKGSDATKAIWKDVVSAWILLADGCFATDIPNQAVGCNLLGSCDLGRRKLGRKYCITSLRFERTSWMTRVTQT